MPKARPPDLSSTRFYDPGHNNHSLTPRTPHSYVERPEFCEIELETIGNEQAEPLLASSSRTRHSLARHDAIRLTWSTRAVNYIPPVFGVFAVGVLVALIVLSIREPETPQRFVPTPATPSTTSHISLDFISYANYTNFPLLPTQYLTECHKLHRGYMHHGDYWDKPMHGPYDVPHDNDGSGAVCAGTVTYMLDGRVGLLADLALMAQAAGLARERNKTFFVDDTFWNRGKWIDHFQDVRMGQPGPEPGCKAPPKRELVACPRTARHWVINSRTAKYHFSHEFSNAYEDPYARELNRFRPMFEMAGIAFAGTIRPNAQTATLIRAARAEWASARPDNEPYIGVHIRRGDRSPKSWRYNGEYIPVQEYVVETRKTWTRLSAPSSTSSTPRIYLASDSPYAHAEFSASLGAGADTTLFSLARSRDPSLRELASTREYVQAEFGMLGEDDRVRATRGMIIDFALVSGMWPQEGEAGTSAAATVCTIGSNVCRLAAVGLGWERSFGSVTDSGNIVERDKRWVEIDNRDDVSPVWEAFELF